MEDGMRAVAALLVAGLALVPVAAQADARSGWAAYLASDYAGALATLKPLAESGDAAAQYYLGTMYQHGHGVARDPRTAAGWYERAARQGHAEAAFALGFLLYYGAGAGARAIVATPEAAAPWLEIAAERGNPSAQHLLGTLYRTGQGEIADRSTAMRWTLQAADGGVIAAQYDAGLFFAAQSGVHNAMAAFTWFDLAARSGYPGAALNRTKVAERLTPAEIAEARARADAWRARH
jgi:TPR repeat protein